MLTRNFLYVKIDDIDLNSGFFQELPPEEYDKLRTSILEFGLLNPVILKQKEDGRYEVIDGRNRIKVLKELQVKEVPAVVYNIEGSIDIVMQYDVELCRRHLDEEKRQAMWEEERNSYHKQIQNSLRQRIMKILKMEDIEAIRVILEGKSLVELYEIYKTLNQTNEFPKLLNVIRSKTASNISKTADSKYLEEKIKADRLKYESEIENLKLTLSEKDETILKLDLALKQKEEELKKLKNEHQILIQKQKKLVDEAIKRKEAEFEKEKEKLQNEIQRLRAGNADPSEVEKMLADLESRFEKEKNELISKYERQIAEWRNEVDKRNQEVLKLQEERERLLEEKKNHEDKINSINYRCRHLELQLEEFKNTLKKVSDVKLISKRLEVARDYLSTVYKALTDLSTVYETLASFPRVFDTEMKEMISICEEIKELASNITELLNEFENSSCPPEDLGYSSAQ